MLFFLHATLLSGHFAKKLKRELRQLREVTEKIGQNDLEFETGPSQIKEIDDVMSSLSGMKEALKDCLYIKRNIIERIENLTEDKIMSKDLITLIQDDL